jgi:hypothetical protein
MPGDPDIPLGGGSLDDPRGDGLDSLDMLNHHQQADETLPPELDPLIRRIEADSVAWRAALPAPDALAQQVGALAQQTSARRSVSYRIREESHMHDTHATGDTATARPATARAERAQPGRLRGILAGTAAVVVVALFAALFLTLTRGPHGGTHTPVAGQPTATARSTPTLAAQHGVWRAIPTLAHTSAIPVVAPSNASVVYLAKGAQLQRSADGGKTWTALPAPSDVPQGAVISWLDVFVSPADANTLWATANLTTASGGTLPNCPVAPPFAFVGGAVVAGGSIPCQVQNVSTDGGQSWKLVKLSFAYMLGSASADAGMFDYGQTYSQMPQVQGDQLALRLYTLTSNGPLASSGNGPRLAVSSDGGQNWQPADTQLANAGLHVCSFAVAPGSRTLFAVTADTGCSPDYGATPVLWRSDDAGAHWTQKTLPSGRLVTAIAAGGGPTPQLYALMPMLSGQSHVVNTTVGPSDVFASDDGGATWHSAPAAGVPTSQNSPTSASAAVTVLSDGSLLAPFTLVGAAAGEQTPNAGGQTTDVSVGLFTWKPGTTAWHEQSQLSVGSVVTLQATQAAGDQALWLVSVDTISNGTVSFSTEMYQP